MRKIVVTFVSGGCPVVEVNGEYFEMAGDYLSGLKEKIIQIKTTPWFNVRSVAAWGGEVVRHTVQSPAQSLKEAVLFKDIVLHETDENTRDHEIIDRIYPTLALLVWNKSEHFAPINETEIFECFLCGKTQYGKGTDAIIKGRRCVIPPTYCAFDECYSHTIWKMLDSKYKEGREPRGRALVTPLHKK